MKGLIDGKAAIVTGAGSGVGRAATLLFARHGARVLASDINLASAEETAGKARAEGGEARAIACDVADEASVTKLIQAAVDAYGRLDIMYNNAGVTITSGGRGLKRLTETTAEDIERLHSINYLGVVNGCKAAIRQFEAQGGAPGVIVNTASIAGMIGFGGVAYGATKGAVVSLTRTLALEVAAKGIRVNSVCPAGMLTHFAGMNPDGENAEAIRAGMGSMYPLGRSIDPAECAKAALFLASDLSSAVTGVNLPVDCGLSAGVKARQ
jgi:NAD(P)-dependent dehydrogenase (short-subunit alcohol dehydrogenase family)